MVLADRTRRRVVFTEELERGLLRRMAEMRRILATGGPAGPRWVAAKCCACGYFPVCWRHEDDGAAGDRLARRVG